MKRFLRLLMLMCLVPLQLRAQDATLPVHVIDADTAVSITIKGDQLLHWPDRDGKTSFMDILSTDIAGRFKPYDINETKGYPIRAHWYSFQLRNKLDKDISLGIQWWGSYFDLYYADSTANWVHLKNGDGYPKADRDGYPLLRLIDFTLSAKEEVTIYLRYASEFRFKPPMEVELLLMKNALEKKFAIKRNFLGTSTFEIILTSFLLGMILVSCIINFTFYQAIREKEYLYFVLFLLAMAANDLFAFMGQFFLDMASRWTSLISFISTLFLFFFLMRFIQYFFKTKQFLPKWNRFLDVYNYLMVFVWIFIFFIGTTPINIPHDDLINDIFGFLIYLFLDVLFVTLFLIMAKKEVRVNIRLLAIVPLLFVFGPLFSLRFIFEMAEKYLGMEPPALAGWIAEWTSLLIVVGIFWVILFFSWLLFKRYQGIQHKLVDERVAKEKMEREREAEKNQMIARQNEMLEQEVAQRTRELQQSLDTLKATQSQLIQSEKMASLGELTAGIAHEIQNPLNFVNNFSEVSKELIGELVDEAGKGNLDQVKAIAVDVVQNLDKVHHHGKRADAIVKGMLQHSRSSSGQKELTDLNAMVDEYVRLAYHGLRAKDKSFNARIDTDYEAGLPSMNVVPQDIGRVVLNLLNNAFYAVAEKLRTHPQDYVPTVEVRTTRTEKGIEISIRDNGNGIPESVKDKIFQPFFTTKPPGQGTGLGLSLSYDIVTKGHGGSLTVDSRAGEGTTFTVVLPGG